MPAVFTWPALSTWVAYTTIFGVVLALLALSRSRIQNWATRRAVYQLKFWPWQHTPVSPASAVPRCKKMRLWFEQLCRNATMRLVPIVYRASLYQLQTTVAHELEENTRADIYFPSPDSNPLYVEIAAYIKHKETTTRDRNLMRIHKGVRCAGGCGTKYGKKRKDHEFVPGGGVKGSGGWFCAWTNACGTRGSCVPEVTGDHYCGMCHLARIAISEPSDE